MFISNSRGLLLFLAVLATSVQSIRALSNNALPKTPASTASMSKEITVGFIGCGTIACAIATGLLTQTDHPISKVHVSRRSQSKSSALASKFHEKVVICDDNQSIVDQCDVLFLCVLPEQEEEVLNSLEISQGKTLVSLVSTSKLDSLVKNSKLPREQVYKMICLPAVAELEGTPLLVPKSADSDLHQLLSTLGGGTCIQCDSEATMEAMMVSTCMMGPVYGLMRSNRDFLIQNGVPAKDANHVVSRQFWGMTKDALVRSAQEGATEDSLDQLINEQTPGGLNEQALRNLEGAGTLKSYEKAMTAVLRRIRGETDGSMNS